MTFQLDKGFKLDLMFRRAPGARATWVRALPLAVIDDGKKATDVTLELLEEVAANTNLLITTLEQYANEQGVSPYRPPVLKEHRFNGERFGSILEAKVATDLTGKPSLYLLVEWLEETWEGIEAGRIEHVSLRVMSGYSDVRGKKYGPCVIELSITGRPVIEDLGTIQDTLELVLARNQSLTPEQRAEAMDEIKALLEGMESLGARFDALEAQQAEIINLSSRIEALEKSGTEDKEEADDQEEEGQQASGEQEQEDSDDGEGEQAADEGAENGDDGEGQQTEVLAASRADIFALTQALKAHATELRLSRRSRALNLTEDGDGGERPGGPAVETEATLLAKGKKKGLRGSALSQYVVNNLG